MPSTQLMWHNKKQTKPVEVSNIAVPGVDIWCAALSPQGTEIAAGGSDSCIHAIDPKSGVEMGVYRGHNDEVSAVAYHPTASVLVSISVHELFCWDTSTFSKQLEYVVS